MLDKDISGESPEKKYVLRNRERAKQFADKVRQGYIPEKRLKDEIVEYIYDSMTGSHDKPTYDDLVELRNYLNGTDNSRQIPDTSDSKDNKDNEPQKPTVHVEGQGLTDTKSASKSEKSRTSDTGEKVDSEPEEIEGKDYLVYEFKQPLGSVSFNSDRTCTDLDGNVIGLWNDEGKIRDHNGKQIGHLPSSETDRFNAFLDTLGIRYKKGIYIGNLKLI